MLNPCHYYPCYFSSIANVTTVYVHTVYMLFIVVPTKTNVMPGCVQPLEPVESRT